MIYYVQQKKALLTDAIRTKAFDLFGAKGVACWIVGSHASNLCIWYDGCMLLSENLDTLHCKKQQIT